MVVPENTEEAVEVKVALALAERLRTWGMKVEVTAEVPRDARGVVFLGGLRRVESIEEAAAIHRKAFEAARAFADRTATAGGIFVTVQDTGGDLGLSGLPGLRAWMAGLPGLVKTAALEWPGVGCKAIDVEQGSRSPEAVAEAVVSELLHGGPEVEVALRADGSRWVVECAPEPLGPLEEPLPVEDGDVVVVSGGARGVTAASVLALASRCKPRLALLGRTPLEPEPACCRGVPADGLNNALLRQAQQSGRTESPAHLRRQVQQILAVREIEANLASLRALGAEVRYLAVDIQDGRALAEQLDHVRREWGPIRGLIHGAGVLADRRIQDKTTEQFDRVFGVKVEGLKNLLAATAADPLRTLVLFSSVAARFGNTGQCDYAMANEVLNKVAAAEQRRRGGTCRVRGAQLGCLGGGHGDPCTESSLPGPRSPSDPPGPGGPDVRRGAGRGRDRNRPGKRGGLELARPARTDEIRLDVLVDSRSCPFLRSHCIEDVPVLPAVLVLEWFVRAAGVACPDRVVASCRDLKVLAGVPLPDLEAGRWFQIVGRERSGSLELELLGPGGTRHYTAMVELVQPCDRPRAEDSVPASGKEMSSWPWSVEEAYEEGLFHGPDFQVLRSLDGLAEQGGTATLCGTDAVGWEGGPWLTNPAALDGGMQLTLLWALHHKGAKSLPSHVGTFIPYQSPVPNEASEASAPLILASRSEAPLQCQLHIRESGRHQVVADLLFSDSQGRPVAALQGLAMTLLHPSKDKVLA